MSVSMFFVSPKTEEQRLFNLPVCTQDVFEKAFLPAAEKIGASYVKRFETGCEISVEDAVEISEELMAVAHQIEITFPEMCSYALPRIKKLHEEIEKIFTRNPESLLYIG